jgi:hypothetical protein
MAAELGQPAAQFRLENYDERHREENREAADDPADDDEVQQLRDQGQGQENDREAGQHFGAAGPAKVEVAVINPDTEQDDLEEAAPAFDPELEDLLHHLAVFKSVSVTRNAATFSLTS